MKKIFHTDVDLYFLKPCIKCIEKVTRNKVIIRANKVNLCLSNSFMEVPPFILKVWKHIVINYRNN